MTPTNDPNPTTVMPSVVDDDPPLTLPKLPDIVPGELFIRYVRTATHTDGQTKLLYTVWRTATDGDPDGLAARKIAELEVIESELDWIDSLISCAVTMTHRKTRSEK